MGLDTKALVKGIQTAAAVVEKRNTIPVLSHLLVSSIADEITLSATDMDIRLDVKMPGKVTFDQITLANPDVLANMLAKAGGEETKIRVEIDETGVVKRPNMLQIDSGDVDMEVFMLPPGDFPQNLNAIREDWSVDVGTDFLANLKQVRGAVSGEETRYYLNGVFLDTKGDGWGYNLVSTDGHRLYRKSITLTNDTRLPDSVIIPRKTVDLLLKLFHGKVGDAPIRLSFGQTMQRNEGTGTVPDKGGATVCRIVTELNGQKVVITSKLIDGSFPDYRRVIPTQESIKFRWSYSVAELKRAIAAFTSYKARGSMGIKLAMSKGMTTLTATWADFGRMRMKLKHEGDAEYEIGFNSKYLLNVLDALGNSERIMFQGADSVSPVVVMGDHDAEFSTIIMPMRV